MRKGEAGAVRLALWRLAPLLGALVLFGLAAFNSRPVVFSDTAYYVWQGETAAQLLHLDPPHPLHQAHADGLTPAVDAVEWRRMVSIGAARSPFYGLPLHILIRLWGGWAVMAAQAAAAAAAVWLAVSAVLGRADPLAYALALVGALGSTLLFFVGFVMPDLFAGVAVLLIGALVCDRGTPSWRGRGTTAVALTACLAMHGSLPMLAAALSACIMSAAVLGRASGGRGTSRDGALVGLAAIVAALGLSGYGLWFHHATGDRQTSPPFLTASSIADGPGRAYLREACAHGGRFELCRFKDRPLASVEEVLWERDPRSSVFQALSPAAQARVRADEPRFVLGLTARYPALVAWSMVRRSVAQLLSPDVEDPLRSDGTILRLRGVTASGRRLLTAAIPDPIGCLREEDRCAPKTPYPIVRFVNRTVLALALVGVIGGLAQARNKAGDPAVRRAARFAALTLLAVLINAVLCGALVGVYARYEARLIWVAPVAAVLLWRALFAARTSSAPAEHQQQIGRPA